MKLQAGNWIGISDKNNDPAFKEASEQEFVGLPIAETLSSDALANKATANRRDFLKYLGFGVGAAAIASCEAPVRRAIPYVTKPDTIVPGVASYYATTYVGGGEAVPILVKTREGRPIKIEGNPMSKLTRGGTNARAQASVLSLYDVNRLKGPAMLGEADAKEMTWADLDAAITGKLSAGSNVRIICNTVMSPTTKKVFEEFKAAYPNTKVVTYDPISSSAMLQANEANFGMKAIPNYRFDKAENIVSFGADFLGTWISPVEYTQQYIKNRKIKDTSHAKMSWHVQIESGMSLTGSNADNRIMVKPSQQGVAISALANALGAGGSSNGLDSIALASIKKLATKLQGANGKCLVVSNSNNKAEQMLINSINNTLGSYGNTIDFGSYSLQRQGIDKDVHDLISEMNGGGVDALLVWDANPVYDFQNGLGFAAAMSKVGLKVSFANSNDETTSLCNYQAPTNHFLESWGDVETKKGYYSLIQPTISPLFNTRQGELSLLKWAKSGNLNANSDDPYYTYLKSNWANIASASGALSAGGFWDKALHDGVVEGGSGASNPGFTSGSGGSVTKPSGAEMELAFYESMGIGSGTHANNPWLQEMPDPIMRTTWGNYLAVPINWDETEGKFYGLNGSGRKTVKGIADLMNVSVGEVSQQYNVVPQFGQTNGSASIAVGYGRKVVGRAGKGVGHNVYPWTSKDADGNTQYWTSSAQISNIVGENKAFPCVQYHHTYGVTGNWEGEKVNVDEVDVVPVGKGYQGGINRRTTTNDE